MADKVKLCSSDQQMFEVEEVVAFQSLTVKNMSEDIGLDAPIPLPNVSSKILAKVIEYCEYHMDAEKADEKPLKTAEEIKTWDTDFVKVDQSTLFELILTANNLNIKSLLDLTCLTVANMIKGKTPAEISKTFNIVNDCTPEEEEEARKKNQWAFTHRDGVDARRKAEEASAAAAAEELIAEEAREAAQAAAKKAKKKKAKARKQQAQSDATSASPAAASEASAGANLQAQQDMGPKATSEQGSPSGTRDCEMPPDQDAAGLQMQLQHMTVSDCAMPTLHEPDVEDEQILTSTSADVGESTVKAVADDKSQAGNATFLDQLFCCPITKVVMVDPVIAADGHTYERAAVQHWLQGSSLSPMTKDKLSHTRLFPNMLIKSALAQHARDA